MPRTKIMSRELLTVSVVTVCYNAEKVIEKTIRSVLSQDYPKIEYIIKDGGSHDKTNEIVARYKEDFEKKGIALVHIIEKDTGIYDAMNQATAAASGEYINFMNADDIFFDETALTKVFGQAEVYADVLYGDSVCEYEFCRGKKEYTLWRGQHSSFTSMPFSHQACFIKTSLMKEYGYDTRFRNAADFHLLARLLMDGKKFVYTDCIVSICTMDGVSNMEVLISFKERTQIQRDLNMGEYASEISSFSIWFMGVKQWMIKHLPHGVVGSLMRLQIRRKGDKIYKNIDILSKEREKAGGNTR